jgi:hypothetical protein
MGYVMKFNAPGQRCPARLGKVRLRNKHWREVFVCDERDARGNPSKGHYVREPVIVLGLVRRYRQKIRQQGGFLSGRLARALGAASRSTQEYFLMERSIAHLSR